MQTVARSRGKGDSMVEEISTVITPVTPTPAAPVERVPEPDAEPETVPVEDDSGKMLDMYV